MAGKRVETKQQNSSQQPPGGAQHSLAHLTAVAVTFNLAVKQCFENADPEAVHGMRTGSRRLQAMLEAMLRESAASALQQPAEAWLKPLKQVRRFAGPVRDLDVHRKLLETRAGSENSPLRKQAELLDGRLKRKRRHLARTMQKQVGKRQQVLAERQAALLAGLGSIPFRSSKSLRSADAVALDEFIRASDTMPLLDAENLHDFRKATKKARYVAESGAAVGHSYSSVAKALKHVQDAIGDWHDWLRLREEARAALGQEAADLIATLERDVERHFVSAMKITETMRGRLSGEWMASHGKRPAAVATINDRRFASGL